MCVCECVTLGKKPGVRGIMEGGERKRSRTGKVFDNSAGVEVVP